MSTKIELTLEQSQEGTSNDVLVSIEGVEEGKRNRFSDGGLVWRFGVAVWCGGLLRRFGVAVWCGGLLRRFGVAVWCEGGELIQMLLLNQKCMGYLVRAYYSISPTMYYNDDSCWRVDLKPKAIEDIISIRSFLEVLGLNHYVLVRKILIKKAQELKTKTFANSDIKDNSSKTKLSGRLLESFQEDAKYEHVGQDTRSQSGKDDQDKQGKDLEILKSKTKSKDNDKVSRSKITQHEGTSLQHNKDQRFKNSMTKQSQQVQGRKI
nr:hypothetical protein [Tanacetum cinerariifolium]